MLTLDFCHALMQRDIPLRMEFVQSAATLSDLPEANTLELAFVGRSNVGKSSLLNFLAGQRQLARVSSTPGRTQLINYFSAEKDAFYLVDLPGYGYALSPREVQIHWEKELARYFKDRPSLIGVLFLVDARREVGEEDRALCDWFQSIGLKVLAVQTKCDKLNKSQWGARRNEQAVALGLARENIISTSSDKKLGLQAVFAGMAGLFTSAMSEHS